MKLIVVTPYFYPKLGGLENYAFNFCRQLKKRYKWNIVVITSNHKERKDKIEFIKGIKIYRLSLLFKISNTPVNPLWYWKIKKIIRRENPDFINAHTPVPFIADIAALASGKKPFFLTYHALSLYKFNSFLFNFIISAYKVFEYFLFNRADKIILVSNAISESIPRKFKKKITVINNSLNLNDIPKQKNRAKQKSTNIIFIGSLDKSHEWKGLSELLLAIKLYKNISKDSIRVNILGDGDNKENYQKLTKKLGLAKDVRFLGRKLGQEKEVILKKSTIGIIYPKSSNDAFPTVALEYWAHSLPIIASDITPINKIIKNRKTGLLIEPQNPEKLAHAIKNLAINKNLKDKISQEGYRQLKSKYVLEKEVSKFYSLARG